jgi:hypothetical protein
VTYTPEIIARLLDEAGEAEVALRVKGTKPSGYQTCMPTPMRDVEDYLNPALSAGIAFERRRWDAPTPAQIAHMDEVHFWWMPLLGGDLWHHWERRRLVAMRALVWPQSDRDDPHMWSWRALGEEFHCDHKTVKARHERYVVLLAHKLAQAQIKHCAATERRLRDCQRENIKDFPARPTAA